MNNLSNLTYIFNNLMNKLVMEYDFPFTENKISDTDFESWYAENGSALYNEGVYCYSGCTKIVFSLEDCDYVFKVPFACKKDYCELEVKNYDYAVEHELDEFFAESFYLTNFCGLPCYCMEKVEVDDYYVEDSLRNYYSEEECENGALEDGEIMVEDLFRFMYPHEVVDTLYDFLSEYKINDVHCSNVGINKKGEMVIIDYSGF